MCAAMEDAGSRPSQSDRNQVASQISDPDSSKPGNALATGCATRNVPHDPQEHSDKRFFKCQIHVVLAVRTLNMKDFYNRKADSCIRK